MSGRMGRLLIEEVAAADLVKCGQILVPTGDDFAHRSAGLELLDGGVVAEEEAAFGEVEMVGIFFVKRSGAFDATAHGPQGESVGYADPDAVAVVACIREADGTECRS